MLIDLFPVKDEPKAFCVASLNGVFSWGPAIQDEYISLQIQM